ncbi:MAG: tetratricopeptide repeat protein [Nitrospirae bacterium]|nr:tetratricopeptide repeat protein [Nitrospirota bacterium]
MNVLRVIILSILAGLFSPTGNLQGALLNNDAFSLRIRAGNHSEFFRIVLEGPDALISRWKVIQKAREISVRFPDMNFDVPQQSLPVPYRKIDDAVVFTLGNPSDLKVFFLDNPGRLVIDAYPKVRRNGETEKRRSGETGKLNSPLRPLSRSPIQRLEEGDGDFGHPLSGQTGENRASAGDIDNTADEGFIPEKYKKAWTALKTENNPYKVIKELSADKPKDRQYFAAYHFIYGDALSAAGKQLEAIEQLRLAYIYSSQGDLRELALIKRARVYQKLGRMHEAKVNYQVFINEFPYSKYIAKAHLGLAKSLLETGSFSEAVEHYENAGKGADVMFSMADALQKLGRTEEAKRAYDNAVLFDRAYIEKSPETYYLMGENMRMTGRTREAKKHLSEINSGPFRDNANMSLGLIAMDESDNEKAIEYFKAASYSKDRKLKVEAMLNLSLAYLKAGKLKESIANLEVIRHKYFDSSDRYKETLLVLSKLYKEDGKYNEALSLLKELVYGKEPPAAAFSELEAILLEASAKTSLDAAGTIRFTDLWKEVGQWMLDPAREEFLLKIAKRLKPEGRPFLELCSWLVENTSGKARTRAALELADYYVGMGNIPAAGQYIAIFKDSKTREAGDDVLRIEARIKQANGEIEQALKNLMQVKEFEHKDFQLLGKIINDLKASQSRNAQTAVSLYEKMIKKYDGEAEDYIILADIYYENEKDEKALEYYKAAYEKDPGDEWAMYRIGSIEGPADENEMLDKLQKGDTLLGRLAKTKLKGISIFNKIDEVYQ